MARKQGAQDYRVKPAEKDRTARHRNKAIEETDPEKAGELLALLTGPSEARLGEIAEAVGLSPQVVSRFIEVMRTSYMAFTEEAREVSANEFLPLIDTRAKQLLQFMTPEKMAKAGIRDQAFAFSVLLEKRQLLRGEPTQILSVDDRRQMSALMPFMLKEAQRRGLMADVVTVEAEEADEPLAVVTAQTGEDIPFTDSYAPVRSNKTQGRGRPKGPQS